MPVNYNNHITLDEYRHSLRADCEKCFGLCCVALYISAAEGFSNEKEAGQPCTNLQADFRCRIHQEPKYREMKGCAAYECFGAGQKTSQICFGGKDWQQQPESARQMFAVFLIMQQLHEMLWYLAEILTLEAASPIHDEARTMLKETEQLTSLDPYSLIALNLEAHRDKVNQLLLTSSELVRAEARSGLKSSGRQKIFKRGTDLIGADLRKADLIGANLRSALLVAADLSGNNLKGADLIGADLRDANLQGADLSRSIFLTQAQVNAARGDKNTKLPADLLYPDHWRS